MTKKMRRILAILPLILLGGCDDSDSPSSSGGYTSANIAPRIIAAEDPKGIVTVLVEMQAIDGTTLYLADSDRLYSSQNTPAAQSLSSNDNLFETGNNLTTDVHMMTYGSPGKYISFHSTNNLTPPYRTYVAFERANGGWIGQTSVVIPEAFTILNPAPYSSISRSIEDPITLSWTDIDETATMALSVRMICDNDTYTTSVSLGADTGTAQVSAADYFPVFAPNTSCHAVFTLSRAGPVRYISEELGTAGGSSIRGIKQEMVEFTSTP